MREMVRKFILMTMTLAKGTEANNNQLKHLEYRKRKKFSGNLGT